MFMNTKLNLLAVVLVGLMVPTCKAESVTVPAVATGVLVGAGLMYKLATSWYRAEMAKPKDVVKKELDDAIVTLSTPESTTAKLVNSLSKELEISKLPSEAAKQQARRDQELADLRAKAAKGDKLAELVTLQRKGEAGVAEYQQNNATQQGTLAAILGACGGVIAGGFVQLLTA
jgi:hypothetical protein